MPENPEIKESETKVRTSVSLSQYLYGRIEDLVKKKEFTSRSDLIATALGEFFGRYDERVDSAKKAQPGKPESQPSTPHYFEVLIEAYLQTPEGKAILQKMSATKSQGNTVNNPNNTNNSEILFENYYKGRRIIE